MKNLYTLYIAKYRIHRGMSQEQLADSVGVSQGYISQLETSNTYRKKSPKLELLIKISNELQICSNDILFMKCSDCEISKICKKRQYVEEDDEEFFEKNLNYYL